MSKRENSQLTNSVEGRAARSEKEYSSKKYKSAGRISGTAPEGYKMHQKGYLFYPAEQIVLSPHPPFQLLPF